MAAHSNEVFSVDIHSTETQEEILSALRQITDSPELQAEAKVNPDGVMDRLKLSGIPRHAVALGIAGLLLVPAVVSPDLFWQ